MVYSVLENSSVKKIQLLWSDLVTWLSVRWKLAPPIWIWLLAGYAWVSFSIAIDFLPSSAGAVLVCICVFCELRFEKLAWRDYLKPPHGHDIWLQNGEYATSGGFSNVYLQQFRPLINLALTIPENKQHNKTVIKDVAAAYERCIKWAIGFSAILGTLIWGYLDWIIEKIYPC